MNTEEERKVFELYQIVLALPSEEREPRLAELSRTHPEFVPEIRKRLAAVEQVSSNLEALGEDPLIGTTLGPFTLTEVLGEGGMGVVYRGEQTSPITRTVAIKKLDRKRSEIARKRFEWEAKNLAIMNHGNIARLFDTGVTNDGDFFFVMEYLDGMPITTYCRERSVSLEERLELFCRICEAVTHAHQKGIVHRDLKPSNVIVVEEQGKPVPKVIDFGIAYHLYTPSGLTQPGDHAGTYAYMSPEQAGMTDADNKALDIDVRADVYALGVILFELLTETVPFSWEVGTHVAQIFDILRERMPPRPSSQISSMSNSQGAPFSERVIRGDLDWITLKALEKDREHRYASPAALTEDIRRYLAKKRVRAVPTSFLYTFKKFAVRHAWGLAAGTALLVALLAGLWGTSVGLLRAKKEAVKAQRVSGFLEDIFAISDPLQEGSDISVLTLLENSSRRLEELNQEPELQAHLMHVMGGVYLNLGSYREADRLLTTAYGIRKNLFGENHLDIARTANQLGVLHYHMDQYEVSERNYRQALRIRQRHHGDDHEDVAHSLNDLGLLLKDRGQVKTAETLYQKSLAIRRRVLENGHPDIAESLHNLASIYRRNGEYEKAESFYKEALSIWETAYGPDHFHTSKSLNGLGGLYRNLGRYDESESAYRRCLEIREAAFGPNHDFVAITCNNLGLLLENRGRYREAIPMFFRAINIWEASADTMALSIGAALNNLGMANQELGQFVEAEIAFVSAISAWEQGLGKDHTHLGSAYSNLGSLKMSQGDHLSALRFYKEALRIKETNFEAPHMSIARTRNNIAFANLCMGQVEEAHALFLTVLASRRNLRGNDHISVAMVLGSLGKTSHLRGEFEASESYYQQALAMKRRQLKPTHPSLGNSLFEHAKCLFSRQQYVRAGEAICEALEIFESAYPKHHWKVQMARAVLGATFANQGEITQGQQLLTESLFHFLNERRDVGEEVAFCFDQLQEILSKEPSGSQLPELQALMKKANTKLNRRAQLQF